jgi:ankyrin repeat protein
MSDEPVNALDAWDKCGMTPLLIAVFSGDKERVRELLELGADPNRPSDMGTTPLWHAEDDFGLTEIAALLRQYGATVKTS